MATTANPRRRRKTTRRRNAATNPRRRRSATAAPRRRRHNPVTALAANPRRRRRNPAVANPRRRRSARRRNPAVMNPSLSGLGKFAMAAAIGGIGSSLVSQVIRMSPIPQSGPLGLLAQVGAGFLVGWGLPKILPIKGETAAQIGMVVAAGGVANFVSPFLDISSVLSGFMPAPAAGMSDVQLFGRNQFPVQAVGPFGMSDVQLFGHNQFPVQQVGPFVGAAAGY